MGQTVLILIDGLRPDAVDLADCPNLQALRLRGFVADKATALDPSISLPSYISIFHSVPPIVHGITTNDPLETGTVLSSATPPGLLDVATEHGLHCGAAYAWEYLRYVSLPGSLMFAFFTNSARRGANPDMVVAREAAGYLAHERPDFMVIHFLGVDSAGHEHGWMSRAYLETVAHVDRALGIVLAELTPDATLLVQSDHGGSGFDHYSDTPEVRNILWMVTGPGFQAGSGVASPVTHVDTAPTLARALGISVHPGWQGRVVEEAFKQEAALPVGL